MIINYIDLIGIAVVSNLAFGQTLSKVQIHVTDMYGHVVPTDSIKITGPVSINALQDEVIKLPYGSYIVNTQVKGSAPSSTSVLVDQPAQVIQIGMKLDKIEGEATPRPCFVLGQFSRDVHPLRVLVVQLFGTYSTSVAVAADGSFEVQNIDCGDYLLVATSPSEYLGSAVARAEMRPTRVPITLGPPAQRR